MALIVAPPPDAVGVTLFVVAVLGMGAVVIRTAINGFIRLRLARQPQPVTLPPADGRVAALEEEVRQLRESMDRVTAMVEFDHQLRGGSMPPTRLPGA